jgi:hypothetical protein
VNSPKDLVIRSWFSIILSSLIGAVAVAALTVGICVIATGQTPRRHPLEFIGDAMAGVFAGALVFQLQANSRRQNIAMQKRLQLIAATNAQIKESVQVMLWVNNPPANSKEKFLLVRASDRIEWILDEVIPQLSSPNPSTSVDLNSMPEQNRIPLLVMPPPRA